MTSMQSLIGQSLGQYKITEQIGEGGMATVFKAFQPGLNREVALKVLPPYIAEKAGFAERFIREAQAIGNLNHPNILPVYDTGQDKGYSYIAMRYIPQAKTLAHVMKKRLTPAQIIHFITQIAQALDYAHQAGIIHRDVKPSNVLLDGDWALLSDFGLAKMTVSPSELTGTGVGLGTPAYMSPEQAKGGQVDHHTDLYALGIILFEMLTGRVPHQAGTPLATVMKRISEPLPSPRSFNSDISPAIEAVLLKALAADPAQRFDSGQALVQALQNATDKSVSSFEPVKGVTLTPPVLVSPLAPFAKPDQPAQLAPQKSTAVGRTIEAVILTLFGVGSVCGLIMAIMSFIPSSKTGQVNYGMVPAMLGMTTAGVTSMLMIFFRNRRHIVSLKLVVGIAAWFVGIAFLGWGGFAALTPGDRSAMTNLGYSLALCFTPGGVSTLLGLALYIYEYRRGAPTQVSAPAEQSRRYADTLQRATDYRARIANQLKQAKGSPLMDSLTPMVSKLTEWDNHLRQLVNQLNDFETNPVIQRDLRDVPAAISRYQTQLRAETNPQMCAQIQETLAGYQKQQQQLDALVTVMRRTELEIDETLAKIGAIYSRLQVLDAKEVDSSRAKRLSADIEEESNRLSDLLKAVDEVYQSQAG